MTWAYIVDETGKRVLGAGGFSSRRQAREWLRDWLLYWCDPGYTGTIDGKRYTPRRPAEVRS